MLGRAHPFPASFVSFFFVVYPTRRSRIEPHSTVVLIVRPQYLILIVTAFVLLLPRLLFSTPTTPLGRWLRAMLMGNPPSILTAQILRLPPLPPISEYVWA